MTSYFSSLNRMDYTVPLPSTVWNYHIHFFIAVNFITILQRRLFYQDMIELWYQVNYALKGSDVTKFEYINKPNLVIPFKCMWHTHAPTTMPSTSILTHGINFPSITSV